MPSSTISIRVNGQWNGADIERAIKDLTNLGKASSNLSSVYTSNSQRIAVQAASTEKSVTQALANSSTKLVQAGNSLQELGRKAQEVGASLTKSITLPMVGVGTYAGAMAVQYDTAMANVRKVTDMTESQLDALAESALELSTTQPVSAETILNVEALGAQLGVTEGNLESFAQTVTGLDIATNLNAEQAATEMARFANITGMAESEYSNFGSTIVALGNNMATTESEISSMAMRLAAAGDIAGMSESEILGMAGAMSSLGIRAEAGGSAMTTIMSKISKAVASGGDSLSAFASVAGMSAKEFASAWQSDPMDAIIALLDGMKRLDEGGQDMNVTLAEMGINEIRQSDAMRRLANDTSVLKEAVDLANTSWQENTALTDEVSQRNESMASRLQVLKNRVDEIAINVGGPLVDALLAALDACRPLIDAVAQVAQNFANADEGTQQMTLGLAAVVAGAGPAISIMGKVAEGVGKVVSTIGHAGQNVAVFGDAMSTTDGALISAYQSADTFASKTGLLNNKIVKAAGGADEYTKAWQKAYDAQRRGIEITDQLATLTTGLGSATDKTRPKIEAQIESLNRQYVAAEKVYDENKNLIDGWAQAASQGSKTDVKVKSLGKSFTEASTATLEAADAAKNAHTGFAKIKDGAMLAASGIGNFVKQGLLIAGVSLAVGLVGSAISYFAAQAAEAEERQRMLTEVSMTFSDVSGAAAASAESQAESISSISERAEEAAQALVDLNEKASDTMTEFYTNSATLDEYVGTIESLANKSGLTAYEQEKLKLAVEGYNEITGKSVEVTDAANGKLSEGTDTIRDNAEAWKENAEAQAYQQLAIEYTKARVQAEIELNAAQKEQSEAQAQYNSALEKYTEECKKYGTASAETGRAVTDAENRLNEANDAVETAQTAYDSASESVDQLTDSMVLTTDAAKKVKEALDGMDGLGDVLSEEGSSIDEFTVALANAGIETGTLNEIGSENIQTLARVFEGNVDQMVWAIQNYNNVPLINKDGTVTLDDEQLIDAQGNLYTWNGSKLVDQNGNAAVNDTDLVDAQGRVYTWNGSGLDPKNGQVTVADNGLSAALNKIDAWKRMGSNIGSKFGSVTTYINNVHRDLFGNAAGGIRLNASGGIRKHADGAYIARRAVPLDIVGEDGAEAIVPLTNRRYSQPFADIIAEGVEKRLLASVPCAMPSRSSSAVAGKSVTYNLNVNGVSVSSASPRVIEAFEVLFDEYGITADSGVY